MSVGNAKIKVTKEMRNKMNKVEKIQKANGFIAINCRDGYRNDNRLWFGECSECGDLITNSVLFGKWEHTLILEQTFFDDGRVSSTTSQKIDYCPLA